MKLQSIVLLLASFCSYATAPLPLWPFTDSGRDFVVLDDEPLYRYYDAFWKCVNLGYYPAHKELILARLNDRLQAGEPNANLPCGFVRRWTAPGDLNIGFKPRYSGNTVTMELCESISTNGISKIPLAVYCVVLGSPDVLPNTGRFEYVSVFVDPNPARRATELAEAQNSCSLNYPETELAGYYRLRPFKYCDCAWFVERRDDGPHLGQLIKYGCAERGKVFDYCYVPTTPNGRPTIPYPVYCIGIPPLPAIPPGFSTYCSIYGALYKYLPKFINNLDDRKAACVAEGGKLAEPQSEKEYECMVTWLRTVPGLPDLWEASIGFTEIGLVTYSMSTGQESAAPANHWVSQRDVPQDRDAPGSDCINVDTGRLGQAEFGKIIDSSCDHPDLGFPSICDIRVW